MPKRPLGLGKKEKLKKHKSGDSTSKGITPVNQIEVELDGNGDPDDAIVQLRSLWKCYLQCNREDELVLNGIIHECDRLLSNQDEENVELNDEFHAIYAQALSELTIFKAGEAKDDKKQREKIIGEFFDAALQRVESGLAKFPGSKLLQLAKSKIIFQRIPLQYISQLKVDSSNADELRLDELLEEGKRNFHAVEGNPLAVSEPLEIFNDLLDIVANFGREDELGEGLDSDDEEEDSEVELKQSHPLYNIKKNLDSNTEWLRTHLTAFFSKLPKPSKEDIEDNSADYEFYRKIARMIGQTFLDAASEPLLTFTTYTYDVDDASAEEKKIAKESQKHAQELTKNALHYFELAESPDHPESWVDTAEVFITMGNLQEDEIKQSGLYKKAEERIEKANVATNGKFKHILKVLLQD
ncbi:HBR244Wp [Eremothecium sinecaudum]|uniref:Enhancer of translation termination 1 n=1 Tax=Eremothecium sinecaudum TaxID=45286 RepID=A0A109UX67_9SACH|nr:HBR244Wp [Eremothecium sinecaudum]AMD19145.1 HBR244Wp [Eremothecium sinecaudum]